MGCVRCHQQVLIVNIRLIKCVVRLLRRRLLALIDCMDLIPYDSTLEKLLLGPLLLLHRLHAIASTF